jgi:flavin-dependent dehydrogenase
MKIAIIGAGLAGLSCAHELEKHGIKPSVYERNSYIGDQIKHVSALIEILNRPIRNIFKYIGEEYGINLKPIDVLTKFTHFSPNKTTVINGNLGYFLKKTELRLNQAPDLEQLAGDNDYVIVANGNSIYTETLGCWQTWLNTYIRGAVILGDFDPHELKVWINKNYCKRGYAYLTPFNEKRASLILITSDVNEKEIDHFWELFLYTENLKYTITEEYKLEHTSGFVYPLKTGNILFAGNAGGAIDPFLGFGQFNSITQGIMAARSIVFNQDYENLVGKIIHKNLNLLQIRKAYDMLDNNGYDMLIKSLGLPGIKHVAYYTPLDVVKALSTLLKLVPSRKRNI